MLGSSLAVAPANLLPEAAADAGAPLVIVNRDPTPLDRMATLVINASIGETLQAVDRLLRRSRREDDGGAQDRRRAEVVADAQLDGVDPAGRQRNGDGVAADSLVQQRRVQPGPLRHRLDLRAVERVAKAQLDAVAVGETGGQRHAVAHHAVFGLAGRDHGGIDLRRDQPRPRRGPGMREQIRAKTPVKERDSPPEPDHHADGERQRAHQARSRSLIRRAPTSSSAPTAAKTVTRSGPCRWVES